MGNSTINTYTPHYGTKQHVNSLGCKHPLYYQSTFFAGLSILFALALKTQTLSYCFNSKEALLNKVLYEDAAFQDKIIPTTQLMCYHHKLLANLIIQAHQEKPLKLTELFHYQVLYQNPQELHTLFNEIFVQNTYYFKAQTEEPVIIDGGSNIGMSVFYFKKLYPKAKIISFEPEKTTFQTLTQNINANNIQNITLIDKALSDKEETIQFYAAPSGQRSMSSLLKHDQQLTAYPVQCVKLSAYITQPVDLLKLDIVGAETKVIQELAQAQKLALIKEIAMVYYHHLDDGKDYLSLTLKTLEDNGFGYIIKNNTPTHQPITKGSKQKHIIYAYKK